MLIKVLSAVLALLSILTFALFLNVTDNFGSFEMFGSSTEQNTAISSPNTVTSADPQTVATPMQSVNVAPIEVTDRLELAAICRGTYPIIMTSDCLEQFKRDNETLNPGEAVTVLTNRSYQLEEVELQISSTTELLSVPEFGLAVSHLSPGLEYQVRIRELNSDWSTPFSFYVELMEPLEPEIFQLCIDIYCAPDDLFPFSRQVSEGTFLPFVEYVRGVSSDGIDFRWLEQGQVWVELQLDESADLGCLNCDVAEFFGRTYESRIRFGTTDIFYNWDLKYMTSGEHKIRARLVNSRFTGPWSKPLVFEVK